MTHVLIVDDELSIRETFQVFLEEEGYAVTAAADFFEAESFLADHPCDVVVADIVLPRVDGLALLQRVREIDEDIPVIMITGEPDVSTAAEAVRYGAYDYVAKPVTQKVLNRVVGRAAERKRLLDDKHRLEAANRAYQAELEKRVVERTAELEQSNRELATLIEIGRDISTTLDLTEVLKRVTQRAAGMCGAHRCTILLMAEDGGTLTPLMSQFGDGHGDRETWRLFKDMRYPTPVSQTPEAQRVIREQRPLFVPDASLSSLPRHLIEPFDVKSVLLVPLVSKERVVGLMALDQVEEGQEFSAGQMNLATAIGAQAAVAIENTRLYETTRRQLARVEALAQASARMVTELDLEKTLAGVVQAGLEALGADRAAVYLYDKDRDWLDVGYAYGLSPEYVQYIRDQFHDVPGYRILQTFTPIWVRDAQSDPEAKVLWERARREGFCSYVVLPLAYRDQIIGALVFYHNQVRTYDEEDKRLCQAIANQAAVAIENARLYEEARRRARQLEALVKVGRAIGSILDLDQVLELILAQLEQVIPYDAVSLWLREEEVMHIRAVRGFEVSEAHLGLTLTLQDDALSQEMVSTRRPLILADAQRDERFHGLAGTEWVRSWLGVPLLSKGEVIGLFTINEREAGLYTAEMAELALAFGQQATIAIENSRLFEAAQRRADELTRLHGAAVAVSSSLELSEVLHTLAKQTGRALDTSSAHISDLDEETGQSTVLAEWISPEATDRESDLGATCDLRRYPTTLQALQEKRTLIVRASDLDLDPADRQDAERYGWKSYLIVPLVIRDQVIGYVELRETRREREFTKAEVRLCQTLATDAAVAIEHARLYKEATRYVEELTALHTIDVAITSILDPDEILQVIYEQVSEVMSLTTFYIGLYDEEKDELHVPLTVEGGERLPPVSLKGEGGDGLSGWVVRSRKPLWVEDMDRERDTLPVESIDFGGPTRSLMLLPLITKDKVVGIISAQSDEPYAFDEGHRRLFSGIASQVAIAVENARLFEETNRRLAETRSLQEVMQAAASTLDFDEVLTRTIETLHRTLGFDYLTFVLPDEQGSSMMLHPSRIGYPSVPDDLRIPLDKSVSGRVYQTGEPQIIPDVRKEPCYFEGAPEILSELAVPVKVAGRVVAVLSSESPHLGAFSEGDKRIFSAVAAQLGVVLENARLYEETKRHLAEARLVQEVTLAAASTLDFDLVLERTVKALYRALGIDWLGFLLPDEQNELLVPHPSLVGRREEASEYALRVPIKGSLVGQAYRTGLPVLMRDREWKSVSLDRDSEICSALAVPVRVSDRIVAVLHAESPQEGAFGEDELRLFTTIAGQLGVALDNARLYQELEVQTAKLSRAYDELQEINRLRTELIQNVGHELRTPLGLVKGYVELLLRGELGDLLDDQRDALKVVRARTDNLERLINNLMVLQAVPREALTLASVSVGEAVRHALTEFQPVAERTDIVFRNELPAELPLVLGDQNRLQLVFSHLVDNAIKFSPGGGTVTICAGSDQEMVYVSIADEGIGIPFERQDRIFERFYQVDGSTSRRFGGMGVGLALVWEIIEAHYGTVMVESEPGEGSTFTVALPRADRAGQ